jgi:hypothetical protein
MAWFDPGRTRLKGPAALTWVVMLGALGMLNAQPPIPPGSWLGQGTSDTEPFGGAPYCNYTVTMQECPVVIHGEPRWSGHVRVGQRDDDRKRSAVSVSDDPDK